MPRDHHGRQIVRVREPSRPPGWVCQLHPTAPVPFDPEEETWHCATCGLDIQDTFVVDDLAARL